MNPLATLHIVRRYGPVGGMERYVWELTGALAAAGHPVTVVCERNSGGPQSGVIVHELGEIARRPRWLSLLRFSRRVARWLREHPQPGTLIHSHERVYVHHVTTFHGPPFATVFERGWWRRVSLRVWMQLYLERRELCAPGVRAVVPNSHLIKQQLQHYYPQLGPRLTAPIPPGATPGPAREPRAVPAAAGVIGFVGKEWQRKGLARAVAIVAELRRHRPQLELWVIGPAPAEIAALFADWDGGFRLIGWANDFAVYAQLDLLLHPARAEPYGMVIAEAMTAAVPVVVSDRCGIAPDIGAESGEVLALDAPDAAWIAACERQLSRTDAPPRFARNWQQVAREYEVLYRELTVAPQEVTPGGSGIRDRSQPVKGLRR
ncbi:MAG: glycosyltransferase family 4 protein [Burkholderiales bacterium]|nr:glycosyltransferase family 4 protein [Burkholderiales bacterium]